MRSLKERISESETILSDGAIGTLLLSKNLKDVPCPEYLNISDRSIIEKIAIQYFESGAEIIQTNTFGASPLKLSNYNLEKDTTVINKNAVYAVRSAVGKNAYVSGSCGPSGKILKPYGDLEYSDLFKSYLIQMESLIGSGVDMICIETMTDINEAVCAVEAARTVSRSIPVITSMTYENTPKGFYTIMGVNIAETILKLKSAGADIIGSNCGNGIDNMVAIAKEFRRISDIPVIIQSNAGIPELSDEGDVIYPETPSLMSAKVIELLRLKVSIIGGCCGTTPLHILNFRKIMDNRKYL